MNLTLFTKTNQAVLYITEEDNVRCAGFLVGSLKYQSNRFTYITGENYNNNSNSEILMTVRLTFTDMRFSVIEKMRTALRASLNERYVSIIFETNDTETMELHGKLVPDTFNVVAVRRDGNNVTDRRFQRNLTFSFEGALIP